MLPPQIDHPLIACERHSGIGAVRGSEHIAFSGSHPLAQGTEHVRVTFLVGAGLQQGTVHVADQADVFSYDFSYLRNAYAALRIERVDGIRLAVRDLAENRHDVSVRMFDE